MAEDKENTRFKNAVCNVAEHFSDFVVIARVHDGLLWRMSDRSFALGACQRLMIRLSEEDRVCTPPPKEEGHV